jgi:hypothetical protein
MDPLDFVRRQMLELRACNTRILRALVLSPERVTFYERANQDLDEIITPAVADWARAQSAR